MSVTLLELLCVFVMLITSSNAYTEVLATDNTCFNAANANEVALATKFNAPLNGIISGIRLEHNSGGTTCRPDRALTNWGCITSRGDRFWTNFLRIDSDETSVSNGNTLYPTSDTNGIESSGTCGTTPQYTYQLDSYGINDDTFILYSDTTSYQVSTDDTFVLGASEPVCSTSTGDNSGTSCAKVYFLYSQIFTCDNTLDIKCKASGDPHFQTWDVHTHHFQGVGYYDYITSCNDDQFFPFTITAKQEECGRWAPMTCIREVRVTLSDGRVIIFPRNGNSDPTWMSTGMSAVGDDQTFGDGTFSVSQGLFSGTFIDPDLDDTEITIMFTYSGAYFQAMTSSDCMSDRICGICGNVNGDPTDDFEKRDGTIVDNTDSGIWRVSDDVWENTFCFGDSWCNEEFTNNPDCYPTPVPTQPPNECFDTAEIQCSKAFDDYCDMECSDVELDYDAWLQDCMFDSCIVSGNNLPNYGYNDALNNGFFDSSLDECRYFCDISDHHPFLSDCGPCNDRCEVLTTELGCANDECLDTCRYCISGIDWDDYDGGQSNQCQCHNNGCDQCDEGWFKIDYDFPCQSCSGMLGCLHCTDFWGCQQCDSGYVMVEDDTCGEDSYVNTGNVKFHYCIPDDGSNYGRCEIGDPGFDDDDDDDDDTPSCPVDACDSNPCDCGSDDNCNDCQSWGCTSCAYGFYKQSFGHPCVSCEDAFDGKCMTCHDWQGCTACKDGYTVTWDNDCGTNICV